MCCKKLYLFAINWESNADFMMHPFFKQHIRAEHLFMRVGCKGYVHLEPVAYSNRQRLFELIFRK